VQTGASSGSATLSTSADVSAVAGDLYLAAVSSKPFRDTLAVSGLGLAWSELADQCSGRSQTGMALWWAIGVPNASGPVTATLATAPENAVLAVSRYSGVDGTLPVGEAIAASTLGASPISCSGDTDAASYAFPLTTTATDSAVFVAVTRRSRHHTPGPGYTERVEFQTGSGGSVASLAASDQGFGAPGAVAVDGSFSDTVDWAAVAVEMRAASGPPPTATPTPTPTATPAPSACSDGIDNDGDGLSDFPSDPGCRDAQSSAEDPKCDDDQDNDLDGMIDWDGGSAGGVPDPQCVDQPWRTKESAKRCGLGFELCLLLLPLLWWQRRRDRQARDHATPTGRQRGAPGELP
jgi:hypothetical protein